MKVIDLFIEYTKDTVQPEKVKFRSKEYTYTGNSVLYNLIKDYEEDIIFYLTDEIEIIEEDKEIEHYDMFDNFTGFGFGGTDKELLSDLQNNFEHINEELDYLIKAVNELKKGK